MYELERSGLIEHIAHRLLSIASRVFMIDLIAERCETLLLGGTRYLGLGGPLILGGVSPALRLTASSQSHFARQSTFRGLHSSYCLFIVS